MPKPQKFCIFCERPGVSKEHIWSEWTRQFLPRVHSKHHRASVTFQPNRPFEVDDIQERPGDVATLKLRVVCERHCNNGWMSRLDTKAKLPVSGLIRGTPTVLTKDDLAIVSRWIAMKFMTVEHGHNRAVTPQEDRTRLMNCGNVPSSWRIWLSAFSFGRSRNALFRLPVVVKRRGSVDFGGADSYNAQFFTFIVGHLLVIATSAPPGFSFEMPSEFAPIARQIHPFTGNVIWPPIAPVSDDALAQIQSMTMRFLRTVEL